MIRVGSQLTFCSPDKILRRTVVEQDDNAIIKRFFSLDDGIVESANTLFYDGILSSGIVSVKQNIPTESISNLQPDYDYYDFSEGIPVFEIKKTDKPLIIDFGTNLSEKINSLLPYLAAVLSTFSVFDIIAACTYYPSIMMGQTAGLTVNQSTRIILWENVDLILKKLTVKSRIWEIS